MIWISTVQYQVPVCPSAVPIARHTAADNAKAYSTRTVSSLRRRNAMHTTRVADEPTAAGGYRPVGIDEDGTTVHHKQASRVQWFFIGALTFAAAIILANKIGTQAPVSTWLVSPAASTYGNGTIAFEQGKGRGRRERWARLSMGRMGASSSFFLRSRRRSIKKQAAKAATRSVVLIGSHFGLGNELLKRLFGDLVSLAARRPLGI